MINIGSFLQSSMLIERFLGGLTFLFLLFFFTVQISRSQGSNALKYHLNWYLFFICVLAFFFIPSVDADLTRLRELGNGWSHLGLFEAAKKMLSESTPVSYFLIYICQKTGVDGLLPMVVALIFYANAFYIIRKTVDKENLSNGTASFGVLFLMCSGYFLQVISGVRSLTAYSIIARCIFDEIYDNKPIYRNILWYVMSFLMHVSVFPLLCIRAFCFLCEKLSNKKYIFFIVFIGSLIGIPLFVFSEPGRYFVKRSLRYITKPAYFNIVEYIIGSIYFLMMLIFVYFYKRKYLHTSVALDDLCRLVLVLALVELAFCFQFSIFHRYVCFSIFLAIPIVIVSIEKLKNECHRYITIIEIVMISVLLLACFRGDLSGYKYFLL